MPHALSQHAPNATTAHRTNHATGATGGASSTPSCAAECDLVLARCDEDLGWVRGAAPLFARVFIYNKCAASVNLGLGNLRNVELIESPNVGSVDYAVVQHIVRFHGRGLANLTLFCEAGNPKMCSPHTVIRPVGLTARWPVPYAPHEAFAANPPTTFGHVTHHMDLASFSSRWWGNCSYGYQSSPKRRFPFVRTPYVNYGAWLQHMVGDELSTDLLSNPRGYLVFGGYFAVEKANLRRYPRALYETFARQQVAPNEEVDHYIERTWGLLFTANHTRSFQPSHKPEPERLPELVDVAPVPCKLTAIGRFPTNLGDGSFGHFEARNILPGHATAEAILRATAEPWPRVSEGTGSEPNVEPRTDRHAARPPTTPHGTRESGRETATMHER